MKKPLGILCVSLVLAGTLAAQTVKPGAAEALPPGFQDTSRSPAVPQENPPGSGPVPETAELKDFYYHLISDGGSADAAALVQELELRFNVFNRLFRFDPAALASPLRVRAFKDKAAYDAYVSARLGRTREGAVYLHYNQRERRELVIHRGSPEEGRMLSYQAFIQFLRGFIPNPPAWIREGFAVYFSTLAWKPLNAGSPSSVPPDSPPDVPPQGPGELVYEENLVWLDTVKSLGDAAPAPEAVFLADLQESLPEHFQAAAWSLASFFLNSGNEDYFRTLTELFMVLSETAGSRENAEAVFRRIQRHDPAILAGDYRAYLASRKTFTELIREGQNAYALRDPAGAEQCFIDALNLKPAHYAPYYYLGLLAYEQQNYNLAENYYRSALQYGADEALVRYALGLNAYSAGRTAEARGYLEQAAAKSPERYRQKAGDLIKRLP
jgi:tetratricopeptide (TPR) repeat protein